MRVCVCRAEMRATTSISNVVYSDAAKWLPTSLSITYHPQYTYYSRSCLRTFVHNVCRVSFPFSYCFCLIDYFYTRQSGLDMNAFWITSNKDSIFATTNILLLSFLFTLYNIFKSHIFHCQMYSCQMSITLF